MKIVVVLFSVLTASGINASINWAEVRSVTAHVQPARSRIIGGEVVAPHSLPYQVGINIGGYAFCGGVLISPNYVLTAAHCGVVIFSADIILGAHNITDNNEPNRTVVKTGEVIVHEGYNSSTYRNDIALIKLSESVTLNDYIQPVKLPTQQDMDKSYKEQIALASGWGIVADVPNPSMRDMSSLLRSVQVEVMDLEECADLYNEEDAQYVNSLTICTTGYRNKGTCNGDSGGPLVINGTLIGLTSFGTDLCESCYPSVYTRVDQFLTWIYTHSDVQM